MDNLEVIQFPQNTVKNTETELKILDAARQEFADKGLSGARSKVIAERAGVNKALLHYYFRSKEKLYEAALRDAMTRFISALGANLAAVGETTDIKAFIRAIVTTYLRTMASNPVFPRLFLRELLDDGPYIRVIMENLLTSFSRVPETMFRMFSTFNNAARIKPLDPVHVVFNIIGMCIVTFAGRPFLDLLYRRIRNEPLVFDDAFLEQRINIITEMAYSGIIQEEQAQ